LLKEILTRFNLFLSYYELRILIKWYAHTDNQFFFRYIC